ncbi:MAG: biotin--[acetyl-CoA-carboxylase] ligase [Acidimicrobiales bacterium]
MWGGEWEVRWFESIDSTNSYLMAEARAGAAEGTVAVADHQRAGRGRLGRRWESPAGASLLASVLLRPTFDQAELHLCSAAVALAAADACGEVAGVVPMIKWPNDLVVGGAKLAGVLAEADFTGPACSVVVGIGLNVAWPGPAAVAGTCLTDLAGRPVDRRQLLSGLLQALSPRRSLLDTAPGRRELASELRHRCATLGQRVRVELVGGAGDVRGVATGIDEAGRLSVTTPAGPRTVAAGDVVHLRPDQPD